MHDTGDYSISDLAELFSVSATAMIQIPRSHGLRSSSSTGEKASSKISFARRAIQSAHPGRP